MIPTTCGLEWEEFLKTVPDNSTVVVYSLDFFWSLIELLVATAELDERGIALKSLQEPWISQEVASTADFLTKLRDLPVVLHRNQTGHQSRTSPMGQGRETSRSS